MANKIVKTAIAVFVIANLGILVFIIGGFAYWIRPKIGSAIVFCSFILFLGAALSQSIEENDRL